MILLYFTCATPIGPQQRGYRDPSELQKYSNAKTVLFMDGGVQDPSVKGGVQDPPEIR